MAVLPRRSMRPAGRHAACATCAALFLAAAGCRLLLGLDPLRVADWHPRESRLSAASAGEVWVEFSGDVDRTKAEQAFSLSEESTSMPGSFSWSGQRLSFAPARPLRDGCDYEIAVLATAETNGGNSLAGDFRFLFTTKAEGSRPTVASIQPDDGARIALPLLPVVIRFSEPVDRASFLAAWSISPDPGGSLAFDPTGSTVTFTPLSEWQPGTEYNVAVSDSLQDLSGNHLASILRSRFIAGAEGVAPTLVAVCPMEAGVQGPAMSPASAAVPATGFDATMGLRLEFDEPVLRANIESFIDVAPAWEFEIDPAGSSARSFTLVPRDRLTWGTLYRLTVRRGVRDLSGNPTASDSTYFFRIDGTATRPPAVKLIRFRTNPEDAAAPALASYAPQDAFDNLDLSHFPAGVDTVSYFDVYLELASGASIDRFSLMKSFSVTATNGAVLMTPIAVAAGVFADPQPQLEPNLVPARISVRVTNTTASGIVTLGVSEDLADSAGNVTGAAFSLPLLK